MYIKKGRIPSCDPAFLYFVLPLCETAPLLSSFLSKSNVPGLNFRIACRMMIACRHGGDDGCGGGWRCILRAFSCCKVCFVLILMQK